jgi:hypothetical protein
LCSVILAVMHCALPGVRMTDPITTTTTTAATTTSTSTVRSTLEGKMKQQHATLLSVLSDARHARE